VGCRHGSLTCEACFAVACSQDIHIRHTRPYTDDNKELNFSPEQVTPVPTSVDPFHNLLPESEPTIDLPKEPQKIIESVHQLSIKSDSKSPPINNPSSSTTTTTTTTATSPPVVDSKSLNSSSDAVSDPSKQPPKKSLLRTTIIRSIVGVLMLIFFYLVLQLEHKYIAVLIVVAQVVTWNEVVSIRYKIDKEKEIPLNRTISWYFLLVSFLFFYGKYALSLLISMGGSITRISQKTNDYYLPIIFVLYVVGFVVFILSLRKDSLRYQFSQLTWTILTLLLIVGQTHFSMQYLFDGIIWIVLPHSMSIVNDIMAYFCGITLGRKLINRRLFALSPNKTWEGFIGAMFFTIAFAFFASPYFIQDWIICPAGYYSPSSGCDITSFDHGYIFSLSTYYVPTITSDFQFTTSEILLYPLQLHAISFALFSSLIAPFGGFLASSIKRAFKRKDFDNIFPGHGGFMDRVDCQLLMCSFVFIYLNTFIKGKPATVDSILSQINLLTREEQLMLWKKFETLIQPL